ncbi:hypothetical protein ACHAP8_012221 [Fusarium lateritium]
MKDTKAAETLIALKAALAKGFDPNTVYDCHRTYSLEDRELWRLRPTATCLHWAFEELTLEVADYLLQHGADINLYNHGQLTVLHEVILDENKEAVAFLLERGANPERRYPDGISCLYNQPSTEVGGTPATRKFRRCSEPYPTQSRIFVQEERIFTSSCNTFQNTQRKDLASSCGVSKSNVSASNW